MKNEMIFLKCSKCDGSIAIISSAGAKPMCCGQEMSQLIPNTVDASKEKHIPVTKLEGNVLTVTIGSVPHPMTFEHHITWVAIKQGRLTQLITLDQTGVPSATFYVGKGSITVFAYCNLHGLWAADVEAVTDDEMVCSAEFSEGCKK